MSSRLAEYTTRVSRGEHLTLDDSADAIDQMMRGDAPAELIKQYLVALATKGETSDEIAGAALALRRHMTPIRSRRTGLVDTCGTGGGGSTTFNISTTAAIVAAAAGVPVAKHGNRSITSRSGSADVLAELGVNISASVEQVEACLDELGLCFCFAPLQHPSMQHVSQVRRELGMRTIFNILGPLANPAGAEHQLLGAGRPELRPLLAAALRHLGSSRTFVVSGSDGMGDVTVSGPTLVTEVVGGQARDFQWQPEDFGIARQSTAGLEVDSPAASAAIIRSILAGKPGVARDIVVLNAAAALLVAAAASAPQQAATMAAEAIDSGRAAELLAQLVTVSCRPIG